MQIPASVLRAAFAGLSKVAPLNPTIPVLGHFQFTRERNLLHIAATDLDRHLVYTHQIEPVPLTGLGITLAEIRWKRDAAVLLVPAHVIRTALTAVKGNTELIILERDAISYTLGGGTVRLAFEPLAPVEFPESPDLINATYIPLDSRLNSAQRGYLLEANRYASKDETRLILNGIFCECVQSAGYFGGVLVATDGRRLYRRNLKALGSLNTSFILPSLTIKLLGIPSILAHDWLLGVANPVPADSSDPVHVVIQAGPWLLVSKTIEGNYPNYRQVIPDTRHQATVSAFGEAHRQLVEVLAKLPPPPKKEHVALTLRFHADRLTLHCAATGVSVVVPGITSDAPVAASYDRRFLADALAIGPGLFRILDSMSPMTYQSDGALCVLMPLRAEGAGPDIEDPALETANKQWVGKYATVKYWERSGLVERLYREGTAILVKVKFDDDTEHTAQLAELVEAEAPAATPKKSRKSRALAAA